MTPVHKIPPAHIDWDKRAIGVLLQHARDCCWHHVKPIKGNLIELTIPQRDALRRPAFVQAHIRVWSGRLKVEWAEPLYKAGVTVLVCNSNYQLRRERDRG